MPIIRNQKTKGVHYKQNVAPNVNVNIGDTYYYKNRGDFYNRVSNVENLGLINEFRAITYTGNGGTNPITGLGFQPDLVWIKNRDQAYNHRLFDSIRGTNISIEPDSTNPQSVKSQPELTSYDSDGFTVGSNIVVNQNTNNIIAWCWKCPNDASHASHDGEKYNTESGISIIKYTGNGVAGRTITHSLGRKPKMFIVKRLSGAEDWQVYHGDAGSPPENYYLGLNRTNPIQQGIPGGNNRWNSTAPTSTTITLGDYITVNNNTDTYIAYIFAEIPNYSKFGSYIGNGSTNGPRITLDFEPAFVIYKNISQNDNWLMHDNKRSPSNPRVARLTADTNAAEFDDSDKEVDWLPDGFQLRDTNQMINANGDQYVYIAFADTTQTTSTWNRVLGGWGPGSDYGYIAGGRDSSGTEISVIDRMIFPFDSGTASHVGNLSGSRNNTSIGGANSSIHGYISAGRDGVNAYISIIDRFSFPFDSGSSSHVGNLNTTCEYPSGNNSSIHGYFCGGYTGTSFSIVNRIIFPFDSGDSANVGNLSRSQYSGVGINSSIHSYICEGWGTSYVSAIDRFIFPFDSGTASHIGNVSHSRGYSGGANSSIHGFICGGSNNSGTRLSIIDRIEFPFDSGTSTRVGNLSITQNSSAGNNSTNYGYICSGRTPTYISLIDRFEFPFNSGTSSQVGNLSGSRGDGSGIDGVDFVSQFADWATN